MARGPGGGYGHRFNDRSRSFSCAFNTSLRPCLAHVGGELPADANRARLDHLTAGHG